jgi:Tol biopolymer transport system component
MTPSRSLALTATTAMLAFSSAACNEAGSTSETGTEPSASASAEAPPAAEAAAEPTILFSRSGTKRMHLAWVSGDGADEAALLPDFGDGNQTNPDWSPDGTEIVFVMRDGTTEDLFVVGAGAADARKMLDCVSPCVWLDDPAWSPDGDQIVFSRTVDRDGEVVSTLETVEVDTGKIDVLLGPFTTEFTAGARWSPDGREIVFELVQRTGPALEADIDGVTLSVLTLNEGSAVRSLTDPTLFAATADWSPDGRWIVYSALAEPTDEAPDLFRINPQGGSPEALTQLVESAGYAAEPTYAEDGTIVFSGGRSADEVELLLRLGSDGTGPELATGDVEVHGRHPRVR